jgi:hypothetical protein
MRKVVWIAAALAATALAGGAAAERREDVHVSAHMDVRFGHNHSYLDRGVVVATLPHEAVIVHSGQSRYWFHAGVWYRPQHGHYVVVAPPVGVFVPALPAFYTTLVFGGFTYYYANEAYYAWRDAPHQYEVVAPPTGVETAQVASNGGATDKTFIYPKGGQSEDQQAKDRYECHRWAVDQTGFDPTVGGAPSDPAAAKPGDYQRAMSACLEARDYTVR